MDINILAVGDVVTVGLDFLSSRLRTLKAHYGIDFTVVNGENASGKGITPRQADSIFSAGADVITLGNHAWAKYEIQRYLDDNRDMIRPANFAPQVPGWGSCEIDTKFGPVCVMNLIGRCSMNFGPENPFFAADKIIKSTDAKIILVDFHAEATSEKLAMGYYLNGRVSAVWGTHTHVQTSDAHVLSKGTGYITDLGMTGPLDSVIGIVPESSISMFLGNPPRRYEQANGKCKLEGAVFTIDSLTGKCKAVEAIRIQ